MKPLFTFLLCLFAYTSFCQTTDNYQLSAPLDLPAQGWNKVIMMRNGNTMLFHLEPRKGIIVKVFDNTHKEIASKKHLCQVLDINALENAIFRGVYDINGQAVMFIEQPVNNRNALVRLCFDATNGNLVNESVVMRSPVFTNKYSFYVLKPEDEDDYKIFYFSDILMHNDDTLMLVSFNKMNEPTDTIPINVNRKDFKYIGLLGGSVDAAGGTSITLLLTAVTVSSTQTPTAFNNTPTIYDRTVAFCYLPKGANNFMATLKQLPRSMVPTYNFATYNPFAQNVNLLLANGARMLVQNGLETDEAKDYTPLFCAMHNSNLSTANNTWLTNDSLDKPLKKLDPANVFRGIPVKMFTNENGLTTIIYDQFAQFSDINHGTYMPYSYFGDIGIDQYDDNGNEIWATALPKGPQYLPYYHSPRQLSLGQQEKILFNVTPVRFYPCQFFSTQSYTSKGNYYILFNDQPENFNDSLSRPGDSLYKYDFSDAMYYKLGRRDSVSKHYLFGQPAKDESKCAFIEGADFDDRTDTYATLVECRKGKNYTLCMGWCHLN